MNSNAIGTSPAFSLEIEHPMGREFTAHLQGAAKFFEIPMQVGTDVMQVAKVGDYFRIDTASETMRAMDVIWAAAEFQYPALSGFHASEHCQHTAVVASFLELVGDDFIGIGDYDSGVDAYDLLAYYEERVKLFDNECLLERGKLRPQHCVTDVLSGTPASGIVYVSR